MSRERNSRFQTGSGCFNCTECGKLTRENGDGNSQSKLCPACFERAGWENTHNDHHKPDITDDQCPFCHDEGWL